MRLLGIEASINWALELIEARIRSACGTAPGIDGVCTGRRTLTTKVKFDAAAMKADNPELHQQFVKTKPGSTALVVARDRNFRRWQ